MIQRGTDSFSQDHFFPSALLPIVQADRRVWEGLGFPVSRVRPSWRSRSSTSFRRLRRHRFGRNVQRRCFATWRAGGGGGGMWHLVCQKWGGAGAGIFPMPFVGNELFSIGPSEFQALSARLGPGCSEPCDQATGFRDPRGPKPGPKPILAQPKPLSHVDSHPSAC